MQSFKPSKIVGKVAFTKRDTFCDGQPDGWTDGQTGEQTDLWGRTVCLLTLMGETQLGPMVQEEVSF